MTHRNPLRVKETISRVISHRESPRAGLDGGKAHPDGQVNYLETNGQTQKELEAKEAEVTQS